MGFDRIPKVDYEPEEQIQQESTVASEQEEARNTEDQEISRAERVVEEYNKTIEFSDWLISLIDERIKDVVVQVDPEEHPEVWMAMTRVFKESVNENLSGRSYSQVLEAVRAINEIELEENQEGQSLEEEFIASLPKTGEVEDAPTPEMDIVDEDEVAIAAAAEEREFDTDHPSFSKRLRKFINKMRKKGKLIQFSRGKRVDPIKSTETAAKVYSDQNDRDNDDRD